MKKALILFLFSVATLSGQTTDATPRTLYGSGGALASASYGYTFYLSGGIYYASNNLTGAVDYSGTDAGVVIRSAIANNAAVCGHLRFASAIYNINSLVNETASGFTTIYYGIGIPASSAAGGHKCQWTIEGDSAPVILDQFATPIQNNGAIFYVTPTAVATVASTVPIVGIWSQPDATYTVGAWLVFKNIDVRFPDNQRGSETGIDSTQAVMVDYDNVVADFNIAQNSLAFPVAGTTGLYGITSTASGHEQNYFKNVYAIGYDHCLDIQSEHSFLVNSYGVNCNYALDYGVRGGTIYHASSWVASGWGESANGLTLGSHLASGTLLDISGLDYEDAATGIWKPVYSASEVNSGGSVGRISFSRIYQGVGTPTMSAFFNGGGGSSFTLDSQFGSILDFDSFTGTAATLLSAHTSNYVNAWTYYNGVTGDPAGTMQLTGSNGLVVTGTSSGYPEYISSFVPIVANYTVSASITVANSTTGWQGWIGARMSLANYTGYLAQFLGGTGIKLLKCITGSCTQLGSTYSVTWAVGSTHTLSIGFFGPLTSTSITVTDNATTAISYVDSSPITGPGSAAVQMNNVALGSITMTNFAVSSTSTGPSAPALMTATNCASAASPAVCGMAASGAVAVPTGVSSVALTVNTSAITANSRITLTPDDGLTIPATTCNSTLATLVGGLAVTARTPGVSFQITYNGTIATNPLCVSYTITN